MPITSGCTQVQNLNEPFRPILLSNNSLLLFYIFQYLLRRKILDGDMTKYSCFRKRSMLNCWTLSPPCYKIQSSFSAEGYSDFCCIRAGSCGEQNCPNFCAFVEGCCCNCIAVSVNRTYLMDQYDLSSDPCDYRLIRINNCLQMLSCVCNLLALFVEDLRELAR